QTAQWGLVAEEVAKVDPNLVVTDNQGQPYMVRYEAINAMLLNEFLKTHCKVEEAKSYNQAQQTAIDKLRSSLAKQGEQIVAVAEDAQRISHQMALSKPRLLPVATNTYMGNGAGTTTGFWNSGFGVGALHNNDSDYNSAAGYHALYRNDSGN